MGGCPPPTTLAFVDRLQRRAIRLIGDSRITRGLDSLEHRRNVGALALFYRYFHGRCSDEIGAIMPPLCTYARATRQATNSHPYAVDNSFCRTVKFRGTFISRTSNMWNRLPLNVFPDSFDLSRFKSNLHSFLLLYPM